VENDNIAIRRLDFHSLLQGYFAMCAFYVMGLSGTVSVDYMQ
jgi:hypothetical protein